MTYSQSHGKLDGISIYKTDGIAAVLTFFTFTIFNYFQLSQPDSLDFKMDSSKITPPGITTTLANQAQKTMGDRPTSTTNTPNFRPDSSQLTLQWWGNKDVRMVEAPIPVITEPNDVICRVTGTTVCGSDLHLYHKEIMQLERGDILGHEWMGIVDEVGSEIKSVKKGDRVVASFQIA